MKLFFSGGAALSATLLAASVLFYAKPLFAEANASQQPTSTQQEKSETTSVTLTSETAPAETRQEHEPVDTILPASSNAATINAADAPSSNTTAAPSSKSVLTEVPAPEVPAATAITLPQAYVATAYSLPGRTASGLRVAKGIIAADPRVLPLGTRVRIEAGPYSGEYVVADTGSAVRGRKIDVWVPSHREACRFGRRNIKLSVLSYGGRRSGARVARRTK